MPTRTAPDVTGAATTRLFSVHFIDVSGDIWSEAIMIPSDATTAEMEAVVDALQAATNASVYEVNLMSTWGGRQVSEETNADNLSKSASVFDRVSITAKHTTDPEKKDKVISIPAPIYELFVNNFVDTDPEEPTFVSDSLLPTSTEFAAVGTAFLAMLGANWNLVWARYHDRGDVNERQPL